MMFCNGVAVKGTMNTDSCSVSPFLVKRVIEATSSTWFVGWVELKWEIVIVSWPMGYNANWLARSDVTNES